MVKMLGFHFNFVSVIVSVSNLFQFVFCESCSLFVFRKYSNKILLNDTLIIYNSTKSHIVYCSRECIERAECNSYGYGTEIKWCLLYKECSNDHQLQVVSSGWNHYCLESRCNGGWVQFGSSCYHKVTSRKDWGSARIHCGSMGSYLAEVTSAEENNFIVSMLNTEGTDYVWLGGTDQNTESVWLWTTSNTLLNLTFTDWSSDQPDNYMDEDCLCIHEDKTQTQRWNDCECHVNKQSICEKYITLS